MIDSPKYRELQHKLTEQTDEKGRIDVITDIAVEVRGHDVEEAAKMAEEIIRRSRTLEYARGLGRGLNLKGSCHWLKGEYEAGLEVLREAVKIAVKIKDRRLEARVLYYLGNVYRDQGDLANVLTHFERALAINEELGDEFSQSVILTSISNLLYDINDYDTALEYALKCLPIFERSKNIGSLINIYTTLGNIYFKQEKFEEAMHYFKQIISYSEDDTVAYVMAESGIGKVHYKMAAFNNAKTYLNEALAKSQHLGNVEVQIICQFYLGRLHMDEDSYRASLQHLSLAYTLANEYSRKHDLMSIHEMLSVLYDKMGDVPKAFHHIKTYEQLKEEIFKQKTINDLRNMQVRQQIELAQKEKEVAERTAHLKHQFMANMSHEIRTPMNAIVGMTGLLLNKNPTQEQHRYLKAIKLSADNLLVIINDILDLSKIEAGKIIIESTDFTLQEILHSVRDMMMLKAEEKHIGIRINTDDTIPRRLIGDPTRLNQILLNLVGNAVKFTEKGYVEIKTVLQQKSGKLWLKFDINDTGIGIAPEYVDTIFDSFTQAGTDVTRKFGGTGLGLTICRQLAGLMGGDISVKSELGKGTTFTVVLPFDEAANQEVVAEVTVLSDEALKRLNSLNILLAEDNEFNRMVAVETFKEYLPGLKMEIAVNGLDAIEMINRGTYDLVLMDIQMPVMDGVTATKKIRTTLPAAKRDIKIIAMTANVLQEDVNTYFEAGMDAYVSKPFVPDELLLKMDAVVNSTSRPQVAPIVSTNAPARTPNAAPAAQQTAATPQAPQAAATPPAREMNVLPETVTDRLFLTQLTAGNPEKMNKYIGMFLDNAPKLLSALEKAMQDKDYPAMKIAAHSLKPQLSYMGVKEEVSHIFMIEQSAGSQAHIDTLPEKVANLMLVCDKAFKELKIIK